MSKLQRLLQIIEFAILFFGGFNFIFHQYDACICNLLLAIYLKMEQGITDL